MLVELLEEHRRAGNYRSLTLAPPAALDFSSNDYLGLSQSPGIRRRLSAALQTDLPLGATGSRLLSGQTETHVRVENFLARTFAVESALLFSSGFLANLGVIRALTTDATEFFSDELNHASLVDGMRGARKAVFRHNDPDHLEGLLRGSSARLKVIVTESVFSMDGDLAPLEELVALSEKWNALLVVDEAHATGVFGDRTLGRLAGNPLPQIISIHTAGKALGGSGAFVLSNAELRALLVNRARSFIFSTAIAPLTALQIEFAVEDILAHAERGSELLRKSEAFRARLGLKGGSQILPLILGSNEKVLRASRDLIEQGFDLRAIRSPTVKPGGERLRLTLKSFHTPADLEALAEALRFML